MTQSIAVAELGPGVGVFGSGADGGREATFDGPVPIRTNGHEWNGYGVIQAKYKEVLGKPKDDATWLISEIDGEMKGWSKRKAAKKHIPNYYIVSTNVRLSPQDDGGIDRVDECLKRHAESLGLTGWLVWHSDSISTFVANHQEVRIAYASWVTPGDVLSQVLSDQVHSEREFSDALISFTAKELLRERYVNLDQAGSADDRSVALAEIFIDLPYEFWSGMEEASAGVSRKALTSLISAADHGRESIGNEKRSGGDGSDDQRFVLIGGPGQGKTTITQFACQMYRSALVSETPAGKFGKVKDACAKISGLMEQEGLVQPKNRRWPVNIQLTRLADDVAKGESTSLLGYLAKTISSRTTTSVSAHQLRGWLATYPWFVVLDGLDEVPAASNRSEVLSLIDDFLIESSAVNADIFVVATTRPQGYTDEFSPHYYKHLQLTPLTRDIAMSYGKKLAIARHSIESDRTDRLIERLERAYAEPATSRLMTTPLQVTILAVLLERVGQAPKDRYNLFADYYRVIYERELEKDSQASALLRDRRSDVDAIHAQVGLLLQTRSEHSGETHSTLSADELGQIVRARLEQEGHKGDSLSSLCQQVIKTATDRLVFLVSTRSDEIGFEIRSLQEFWAGQGIMHGTEAQISNSLRRIASSSHWRNTLLFALGHIFSKRETLRDTVIALVSELNSHSVEHGEVKKAIWAGSRLAVAILSDGIVRSPIYLQSLTDQAVQLFQLPPDADVRTVPSCIAEEMIDVVVQLAEGRLQGRAKVDDLSLLYALSVLSRRDDLSRATRSTLKRFIAPLYDKISDQVKQDALKLAYKTGSLTLHSLTQDCLVDAPLQDVVDAVVGSDRGRGRAALKATTRMSAPEWVRAFRSAIRQQTRVIDAISSPEESLGFDAQLRKINSSRSVWQRLARSNPPKRNLMHELADFGIAPGAESLAVFLRAASNRPGDLLAISNCLPWVVTQVLVEEPGILEAASAVESGEYGDLSDWEELEGSWAGQIHWQAFLNGMKDHFREGVDFYPLSAARGSYMIPNPQSATLDSIKEIFASYGEARVRSDGVRQAFASWLLSLFFVGAHANGGLVDEVGPSVTRLVLEDASHHKYFNVGWMEYIDVQAMDPWIDCLDFAGKQGGKLHSTCSSERIKMLLSIWMQDPSRWGIARLAISARHEAATVWREPEYWSMWRASDISRKAILDSDAEVISLLVAAVFGEPESRAEARTLCDEMLSRAASGQRIPVMEGIRGVSPGRSHLSRVFSLMCAEELTSEPELRQMLMERLVEVFGQDPSGLGEVPVT
ncbi:NACHT domain-containing protein [Streptomyces sp. NPDC060064]|uniref:NACHT domain-containing protein n=1 Tax=Streptomyces sp. NPDC060064 TaxID=3347049 RepID=UPI00367C9515